MGCAISCVPMAIGLCRLIEDSWYVGVVLGCITTTGSIAATAARATVLDKLFQGATDETDCSLTTHGEINDSLLAIIGNGDETVAMTLQALYVRVVSEKSAVW